MTQKEKRIKLQRKIGSALSTLVLILSMILCFTVVTQVMTRGYVEIGGFSLFRVVTGSMEPTLPVGTLLLCKDVEIEAIQEGDIVCFRSRSAQMMGKVITHRVVGVYESGEGERLLETKGDANLSADGEFVTQSNLIGRVDHYAKDGNIMASLIGIMTNEIGFLILILFPTLLIAGFILRSCMMNMRRDIEKALQEEEQRKQEESRLYTDEEYAAMMERLRKELLEEMKQGVEEHDKETEKPSKTE